MALTHSRRAFSHMERDLTSEPKRDSSRTISTAEVGPDSILLFIYFLITTIQKYIRAITYEWIMTSLVDVWHRNLAKRMPYWEQPASQAVTQLYAAAFGNLTAMGTEYCDESKVIFALNNTTTIFILTEACLQTSRAGSHLCQPGEDVGPDEEGGE